MLYGSGQHTKLCKARTCDKNYSSFGKTQSYFKSCVKVMNKIIKVMGRY